MKLRAKRSLDDADSRGSNVEASESMCETRDLGMKWPQWHTLIFSNDTKIDMRCVYVCPKDVQKMLVQRARSVYWKNWAAKHEYEESKREHGSNQGWLSCARKRGLKSIAVWPGRSSWKEVGRKKGFSILDGRISVSVKLARWRKRK